MSEPVEQIDPEFDAQLRGLFQEAERSLEENAARSRRPEVRPDAREEKCAEQVPALAPTEPASIAAVLKPLALGLDSLARTTGEQTLQLKKMAEDAASAGEGRRELAVMFSDLRTAVEQRNGVNQRLFDALHEELRGYKDAFLAEAMQKPIIRDLISLYDDLTEMKRQVGEALSGLAEPGEAFERIKTLDMNMENHLGFLLEVLARLDVAIVPEASGQLDKHRQRAVGVESTDDPREDLEIARTAKRGFLWKSRVFRAEEVIVKKHREGLLTAMKSPKKP